MRGLHISNHPRSVFPMSGDSYGVFSPSFARPGPARRSSLSSLPQSPPRPQPSMTPNVSAVAAPPTPARYEPLIPSRESIDAVTAALMSPNPPPRSATRKDAFVTRFMDARLSAAGVARPEFAPQPSDMLDFLINKYLSDDNIRQLLTGNFTDPDSDVEPPKLVAKSPKKRTSTVEVPKQASPVRNTAATAVAKSPAPQVRPPATPSPKPTKKARVASPTRESTASEIVLPTRRNPRRGERAPPPPAPVRRTVMRQRRVVRARANTREPLLRATRRQVGPPASRAAPKRK